MTDRDGNTRPPRGVASARLTEVLELARAKRGLSIGEALEGLGIPASPSTPSYLCRRMRRLMHPSQAGNK